MQTLNDAIKAAQVRAIRAKVVMNRLEQSFAFRLAALNAMGGERRTM